MNDVYYNPETGHTHYRRKKKSYGCGRTGWFAGHHGSTFSAFKQPPMGDSFWREMRREDKRGNNKAFKRTHNRKARRWFRDEIHHLVRGEVCKL